MIDYQPLYNTLLDAKADAWVKLLPQQLASAFDPARHGNLAQWQSVLECLPELTTKHRLLDADAIQIGRPEDLSEADRLELEHQLKSITSLAQRAIQPVRHQHGYRMAVKLEVGSPEKPHHTA